MLRFGRVSFGATGHHGLRQSPQSRWYRLCAINGPKDGNIISEELRLIIPTNWKNAECVHFVSCKNSSNLSDALRYQSLEDINYTFLHQRPILHTASLVSTCRPSRITSTLYPLLLINEALLLACTHDRWLDLFSADYFS